MIRLLVSRETGDAAVYEFNQDEVLIGRMLPADVVLDNDGVSRRHTRISRRGDGWRVADLGAPNGVFLQKHGEPPAQRVIVDQIEHGDVLCIERFRVTFEVHEGATSLTPGLVGGEAEKEHVGSFDPSESFTRVTTLPGFRRPKELTGNAAPAPRDAESHLQASLALASGSPLQQLTRENNTQPPQGRPTLEIYEEGKPARTFTLTSAPVQFGADVTCDVRMAGLTVPRFVASLVMVGNKVLLRRVSTGLLGPKVTLDDQAIKEAELEDGQKFFVGPIAGVLRLPRGRG